MSDMSRKYARVLAIWALVLAALYVFQETFTP